MLGLAVVGFHRSGTSMLAGILHKNGMSMGSDLLGASYSNPYGHFEDKRVISINDSILERQNGRWYNDFAVSSFVDPDSIVDIQNYFEGRCAEEGQFGFKDPRLMTTLGTWTLAVPELRILYIHRGFRRSCYSLWLRAYRDLALGRATELNDIIVRSKEGVVGLYINNVMNFLSLWASDESVRTRTAFIDYDALQAKEVNIRGVLGGIGIDFPDVDLDRYIDPDVISAEGGFQGEIDQDFLARALSIDTRIQELCTIK